MQISLYLTLLLTFTALQAQQYTLNLSSPSHAGERYSFSAKATKLEQIIAAERQVKSEEYRVNFEGQAEVLEVDAKGQPFKISFTVERFNKLDGTETTELLKSGSVIVADGSQTNYLTLTGRTLPDPAREAFGLLHAKHKHGAPSDDEIFSTREPRSLADTWPIDPAGVTEGLADGGIIIPRGHLSGTVSLLAKEKVGAAACLSVRGEVHADSVSSKALPPDMTLDEAEILAAFRGCFPVQRAGLLARSGVDLDVRLHMTSKEGHQGSLQESNHR